MAGSRRSPKHAGVAYSAEGRPRGGMGVDSADYNQDGWMDLFVTNLDREMFSMYRNNRDETFDDDASRNGIGAATRLMSGWGLKFFDYDNDGNLDLFLVNGEPDDQVAPRRAARFLSRTPHAFSEHRRGFKNISSEAGPVFCAPHGVARPGPGRLRQRRCRGRVDFKQQRAADAACETMSAGTNHWLGLKLVGKKSNLDAIGARISYQAGDLKRSHMKVGGGSYLSSHDPRMVLGTRQAHENRLAGSHLAPTQRPDAALHQSPHRPLRHYSSKARRSGNS